MSTLDDILNTRISNDPDQLLGVVSVHHKALESSLRTLDSQTTQLTTLNTSNNQRSFRKTTGTTVTMSTGGESLAIDTSSGNVTVTIPTDFTVGTVIIKKISKDANTITIKPEYTETINDGASGTSFVLQLSERPAHGSWSIAAIGTERWVSLLDMPWTPLDDPDCILWLEPNCGVVLSDSDLISWTDRTSGVVCTPTGANKWQRDNYIGGEFVGFSCLGYPLSIPVGSKLVGATGITLIVTCYDENNSAAYMCEYGTNGAANVGTFAILPNFTVTDSISIFSPGSGGANQWRATTGTITLATPKTLTFKVDYALSTNEISPIRSNGADLAGSYITNTNSSTTFAQDTLYFGARGSGGNGWLGHVLDIVLIRRAVA